MTDIEMIKKRIQVLHKDDIPTHIVTKNNEWYNGYIVLLYDDYMSFMDRIKGILPIFYVDIDKLEFFKGDISSLKKKDGGK